MANNLIIGIGVALFIGGMVAKKKTVAGAGLGIIILGAFL
jgi:hypothetical protein